MAKEVSVYKMLKYLVANIGRQYYRYGNTFILLDVQALNRKEIDVDIRIKVLVKNTGEVVYLRANHWDITDFRFNSDIKYDIKTLRLLYD